MLISWQLKTKVFFFQCLSRGVLMHSPIQIDTRTQSLFRSGTLNCRFSRWKYRHIILLQLKPNLYNVTVKCLQLVWKYFQNFGKYLLLQFFALAICAQSLIRIRVQNGRIISWKKWSYLVEKCLFQRLIYKVKFDCTFTALLKFWQLTTNNFLLSSKYVLYLCSVSSKWTRQ